MTSERIISKQIKFRNLAVANFTSNMRIVGAHWENVRLINSIKISNCGALS